MIIEETRGGGKTFLTILATTGKLHQKVDEGTEGAIKRDIIDKKTQEVTGTKFELQHDAVSGIIEGISIVEVNFGGGRKGKNLQIEMEDETISTSVDGVFGERILAILPNVDLSKPVKFKPYEAFITGDGTPRKAGITLYQDDEKVKNYYRDFEAKKDLHGIPEAKKDEDGDWIPSFKKRNQFMRKELEKLSVYKKVEEKPQEKVELSKDDLNEKF